MPLACIAPRSGFGELALLYSAPRAASVRAAVGAPGGAGVKCWAMDRAVYAAIKRSHADQLAREKGALVEHVPVLAALAPVRALGWSNPPTPPPPTHPPTHPPPPPEASEKKGKPGPPGGRTLW